MIKGVTPEDCIANLFEIIQRYSVEAPLKILLNFKSFILTNGQRWFSHVALIYRQKHFMSVQREIKLSGLKGNNLTVICGQKCLPIRASN
jgi:hypothetical protein